jgi:hypothetical protein
MPPAAPTRRLLLALAMLVGLVALGGCHVHHDDDAGVVYDEILFTVTNLHDEEIYIEAVDSFGRVVEFGHVYPGEELDFIVSDTWEGRLLYARCTRDGALLDSEIAFDGLHWDVY